MVKGIIMDVCSAVSVFLYVCTQGPYATLHGRNTNKGAHPILNKRVLSWSINYISNNSTHLCLVHARVTVVP